MVPACISSRMGQALLGLGLIVAFSAWAGDSPAPRKGDEPLPYTNTESERALRNMQKIGAKDPSGLNDTDGEEWVRSRFAWVALLRLEGKDEEAADVFAGCGTYCGKWGPSLEWGGLKKWGCARRPDSVPCRK